MDEYIVKHLLKKNKEMSKSEAEKRAAEIWDAYCEVNKERDEKREKEFQKECDKALQSENDAIAFEYLSSDELVEYLKGSKKND
jgi:predicted component of type VI protein secretion system